METSLVYRTDRKHLCVAVKEKLSAGDVQLKFKGLLDTVAGGWENALWLHRTASFRPSSYSTPQRRGNKYQGRADPRVRLGAGIFIDAKDGGVLLKDDVHLNCRGRAQWQLWDYERHQLDLDVSYNPQGKRIFGRGGFHIHKVFRSIASNQDVKITVGNYWHFDEALPVQQLKLQARPFMKIQENNWAVWIDRHKQVFTYDL